MGKKDRYSAQEGRTKFDAEIEYVYTHEQREEANRLLTENPAKGRIPKSTVGKVHTLRKRGVKTSLPPFEALTPVWVQGAIDDWSTDEIRAQQIIAKLAESFEGVDKTAAQRQSVDSKRLKLHELLERYAEATGKIIVDCTDARPLATWAVDRGGFAQRGATRTAKIDNLTKRIRRMIDLL